jgi:hypothetical protein
VAAIKKGFTDNGPPKSLTLSQRMSANKRSKMASSGHTETEHMKNLASLQKRILDVGNKQDRKKNPFDPIGNPVYFFTKD